MKKLFFVAVLLTAQVAAAPDHSTWLKSLTTSLSALRAAKPKTTQPNAETLEHAITSRPNIAAEIVLSQKIDSPMYWVFILTNHKVPPVALTGKADFKLLSLGGKTGRVQIINGTFAGAVFQETEAYSVAGQKFPREFRLYSPSAARANNWIK